MIRILLFIMMVSFSFPLFAMGPMPKSSMEEGLVNSPAPEFGLETSMGVNKTLKDFSAGKKTVLFFWATWCPHCHEELEKVRQNLDDFKEKNIQIVLINVGETREEV